MSNYTRYSIPTHPAPNLVDHPSRFKVLISKFALLKLLVKEFIHYRGDLSMVLSRPCVYGVFSGPLGGFTPREKLCVGCLRCTIQYPDVVQIMPNPARRTLGDSYFNADMVDTVLYESSTGRIPVRGSGYGGRFGGSGWDSIWTDMSEIVRPTRDGIHGREFISTSVDIGGRPAYLQLSPSGSLIGERPHSTSISVPIMFDPMPEKVGGTSLYTALMAAAEHAETFAIIPIDHIDQWNDSIAPLVLPNETEKLSRYEPRYLELNGWDQAAFNALRDQFPQAIIGVRLDFSADLIQLFEFGVRVFHLIADYHGQTDGEFTADAVWRQHDLLVKQGVREQVTLIGSGGLAAAEHIPKALIRGLDAVALDTPALIALQATFHGEVRNSESASISLPSVNATWAEQRLTNLLGSWRDQLLEIMGAMGLREVRRLRGEIGRSMNQSEMEQEAFSEIPGFG
jgi:hypothetical protein